MLCVSIPVFARVFVRVSTKYNLYFKKIPNDVQNSRRNLNSNWTRPALPTFSKETVPGHREVGEEGRKFS